jgi:hypothetical protein
MEKLYVTVGLFYSRGEAENVVAQLRCIPEKTDCRYEIIEAAADSLSTDPPKQARESGKE